MLLGIGRAGLIIAKVKQIEISSVFKVESRTTWMVIDDVVWCLPSALILQDVQELFTSFVKKS